MTIEKEHFIIGMIVAPLAFLTIGLAALQHFPIIGIICLYVGGAFTVAAGGAFAIMAIQGLIRRIKRNH